MRNVSIDNKAAVLSSSEVENVIETTRQELTTVEQQLAANRAELGNLFNQRVELDEQIEAAYKEPPAPNESLASFARRQQMRERRAQLASRITTLEGEQTPLVAKIGELRRELRRLRMEKSVEDFAGIEPLFPIHGERLRAAFTELRAAYLTYAADWEKYQLWDRTLKRELGEHRALAPSLGPVSATGCPQRLLYAARLVGELPAVEQLIEADQHLGQRKAHYRKGPPVFGRAVVANVYSPFDGGPHGYVRR